MSGLTVRELRPVIHKSGASIHLLTQWCSIRAVRPSENGDTNHKGQANRFSLPQSVGILVAAKEKQTVRGCHASYVTELVNAFASVTPEWLLSSFSQGNTHLAGIWKGKPILEPKRPYWTDVKAAYNLVAKACKGEK